jgi:lipopolysaccharide export system protein LptC
MSSLTDGARGTVSPAARRASRRARMAPYISAGFAAAAVAILIAFAYQAGFFEQFAAAPPKPPATQLAEQVTVSQSTITGFDRENLPYSVTAQSAVQDKDVPSRVYLKTISGESQRATGEIVKMKADSGLYDTEARELSLAGAVMISSEGRFSAHMDKARLDVREKKLVSYSPVTVDLPNGGTIDAKALQITNDGNNILFFNGVRAKFKSNSPKGDGSP